MALIDERLRKDDIDEQTVADLTRRHGRLAVLAGRIRRDRLADAAGAVRTFRRAIHIVPELCRPIADLRRDYAGYVTRIAAAALGGVAAPRDCSLAQQRLYAALEALIKIDMNAWCILAQKLL